jgi:hypothetical protein
METVRFLNVAWSRGAVLTGSTWLKSLKGELELREPLEAVDCGVDFFGGRTGVTAPLKLFFTLPSSGHRAQDLNIRLFREGIAGLSSLSIEGVTVNPGAGTGDWRCDAAVRELDGLQDSSGCVVGGSSGVAVDVELEGVVLGLTRRVMVGLLGSFAGTAVTAGDQIMRMRTDNATCVLNVGKAIADPAVVSERVSGFSVTTGEGDDGKGIRVQFTTESVLEGAEEALVFSLHPVTAFAQVAAECRAESADFEFASCSISSELPYRVSIRLGQEVSSRRQWILCFTG